MFRPLLPNLKTSIGGTVQILQHYKMKHLQIEPIYSIYWMPKTLLQKEKVVGF